ncbi:GldG family protein [Desulfovermiculus halophilus]|uniref:GldG family protein n=1 Tax=Desulfovermiculus halophilus TaxID=339722 RepID=UPI00048590E1|nr:GldG family protein [Desulfovermiculus halophilus]
MLQGRTHRYITFGLFLVLIVLLNIAAQSVFVRWDLTEDNMYSLSPVSKEAVSSLAEPLTVKAYFSQELPPPYNTYKQYLRDLLREYSQYATGNFNYEMIQISPEDTAKQEAAQNYGIQPVQVQVVEADSLSYKKAYMGAALIHGDAVEHIPAVSSIKDLEYTLTSSIQKLKNKVSTLLNLDSPVRAKLIMSPSLEKIAPAVGLDSLPGLPDEVRSIIQEANAQSYGRLKFELVTPKTGAQLEKARAAYNLQEVQWPAIEQQDIPAGSGVIGLVLEHRDSHRTLSLLNVTRLPLVGTQYSLAPPEQIRELINLNLKSLLGINQTLGYLTDHGTLPLNRMGRFQGSNSGSAQAFQQLAAKNYSLREVTLEQGIPEGLNCLIIAGARQEFSKHELYQLDQALMRGTNLAVFKDSFINASQSPRQPPHHVPNTTGLNTLLAHYGLHQEQAMVYDKNCYQQKLPRERGGGEQPIYFAPMIEKHNINHDVPYLRNINGLLAFQNSPVRLDSERLKSNGLHGKILFSTSRKSWTKSTNPSLNPMTITPPADAQKMQNYPLAALVSGKFPSYFAHQPIPVQESKQKKSGQKKGKTKAQSTAKAQNATIQAAPSLQAKGEKRTVSQPGKILLIGSSSMISDTILDTSEQGPNSVLIMNLIDALNGQKEMASLRSKIQEFNPLRETSNRTRTAVKAVNIVGLPCAVILFGLLIWAGRVRRKQKIKQMFASRPA